MKAEELRIGNLVLDGEEVINIDIVSLRYMVDNKGIEIFKPIPLTEEWLLKLGFNVPTKHHVLCYDLGLLSIEIPNKYYPKGRAYFNSWVFLNEMPKYVHQLQNIYFALAGEELEYNGL